MLENLQLKPLKFKLAQGLKAFNNFSQVLVVCPAQAQMIHWD
jgi:hypothetical protein